MGKGSPKNGGTRDNPVFICNQNSDSSCLTNSTRSSALQQAHHLDSEAHDGNPPGFCQMLGDTEAHRPLGMTEPSDDDRPISDNEPALKKHEKEKTQTHNNWCYAPIEEVRKNFSKQALLRDQIVFVKGPVEETLSLQTNVPNKISFLRLDTDWYESTKVVLTTLYPKIVS